INALAMNKRNFRMEFNPNKLSKEQKTYLRENVVYILDDISFSRLDLAIDVFFNLSEYTFNHLSSLKSAIFRGRTGKVETMYYGSRFSDFYYRIYDKKQELWDKKREVTEHEEWWRFELEIKNSTNVEQVIDSNFQVLDDLQFIKHDLADLPINEKLKVRSLIDYPEYMEELAKATRAKYRKIIRGLSGEDITPELREALKEKTPELISEINSWRKINVF